MSTFSTIISYIQAGMPELNSTSIASTVNKMAEAIAQAIDNTLTEITNSETIITDIITNKNFGHPQYYTDAALAYQTGVNLSIDPTTLRPYYATTTANLQIVKQAAFQEVVSGTAITLVLKVAKVVSGSLAPLDSTEYSNFQSYMLNFEIPGLPLTIISGIPNSFAFTALITYNINYDFTTLQANIATALTTFATTFTFNGILDIYKFENYLVTNVAGVNSVYVSGTTIDTVSFSGSTALANGYFNYGAYTLTYAPI